MATSFEQALLRFKNLLQVQSDKQVAEHLGMSPTAFNDRKKRDVFPDDKLWALASRRPDLNLDVVYILTGKPMEIREGQHASGAKPYSGPTEIYPSRVAKAASDDRALASKQAQLVTDWQACSPIDQSRICDLTARLAEQGITQPPKRTPRAKG